MKLSIVTGSENKVAEIQRTLGAGFELEMLQADLPEMQSRDVMDVVRPKLAAAKQEFPGRALFVEDTSFSIDAFGDNFPGALVKHLLEAAGSTQRVYDMARGAQSTGDLLATASVCVGYTDGQEDHYFTGEISGKLVPKICDGWGFDEILVPDGYDMRLCEIDPDIKATMNHRAKAVLKLKEFLLAS